MKKIIIALFMVLGFANFSSAQTGTKTTVKKDSTAKHAGTTGSSTKTTSSTTSTVPLKKDGTPDKRYKKTETTTHVKKDGTPDKRYKENKKP